MLKIRPNSAWTTLRSLFQWAVGIPVMTAYVFTFAFLSLFVHHIKLDFILRAFARTMVWIAGLKLEPRGLGSIDWSKPYVLAFNHTNVFDHFVIYALLPQIARGVEREDHFNWPVHGLFLRRIGQIPIPPRGDTKRAILALEKAKALFRSGVSIAIAPEGTRSPTGELLPFKKGAFHMAVDLEADVLPIILKGMFRFNRKGSLMLHPGSVEVYFEPPVPSSRYGRAKIEEFKNDVRKIFEGKLT